MNLEQAIEKIAALEKRIEELEKRPPVVIHNYPPANPWYYTPMPIYPAQPFYIGDPPYPSGPTCGAPIMCATLN